ncbi:site-specific integrase [Granulicella sp. dw_53]|uniref:tyrosine-type recombinase/integrase n=1 Tax=Granulicella sp. dw_53 TaxID=2719792 RepID=UPI001BD67286|nr:site-specific integrase [Granulicella sp. dw_53]
MGKSQQAGWVSIRGRYWYGYYRETVLDPETNEERVKKIPIRLGLKTQLNKLKARLVLREEITKRNGQIPEGRVLKDGSVTFEWFVRNRYFPLRKGDWRPETAVTKMDQIEIDLIGKFGEYPLDALDKFVLQTHLNALAERYCQDRVKQDRSYLKSIFDEAIEQEYLTKDPTRKLKTPKNLRPKDKQVLSWEQLWSILEIASRRDRLLLALDMTEALRPSELFALRWRSFDDQNTLTLTETVYRRTLRPFGKTPGSLTKVHLPDGLANELLLWKVECKKASCKASSCQEAKHRKSSPDAFIFPNADGGFMDADNYRFRVLKPLAEALGVPKLNFQVMRRTMATQAQKMGSVKDIQAHLRHSRPDTTANEYMQSLPASVQEMVGSVYLMLMKGGEEKQSITDLPQNATNFSETLPVSY